MLFKKDALEDNMNEDISLESAGLITSAILMESLSADEIDMFVNDASLVEAAINEQIVTEKTIVRLDKSAKLNRAFKSALFTVAKEKKDPLYKKLVKVWKMERFLEAKIEKKYQAEATRRAKIMVKNLKKSKVKTIAKAGVNAASKTIEKVLNKVGKKEAESTKK
ncbi:MAG: hypothetical protein PHF63_00575 [Herbinix sp.]|nr:hypothetical protein [Herbinix sp.]